MSSHPPVIPTVLHAPVDIVVVGGGPVGLFAAFYAGLRRLTVKIVDAHDELGGQLKAFYPQDHIYDIPSRPAVCASELARDLAIQAYQASPVVCLSELVHTIEPAANLLNVVTNAGVHPAKAVIVAVGIGAIRPKSLRPPYSSVRMTYRLADISGSEPGHLCILGADQRTPQTVAALLLLGWKVSIVSSHHLADQFPHNVTVYSSHDLVSVTDQESRSVVTMRSQQGVESRLPVDRILIQVGLETSLRPLLTWNLNLEGNGILVDSTMSTSRPGVYAIGDIATYPGKVKLIAVGFGEAATAINHIAHRLNPSQKVFPGYSTSIAPRTLPNFGQLP